MKNNWYKKKKDSQVWWKYTPEEIGVWIFSFDRKKEYNMFRDYPYKLTEKEKEIFDKEYPNWKEFFSDRQ